MKISKVLRNLIVDVLLAGFIVLVFLQELTGDTIHQYLGIGFVTLVGVHLLLHWKWIWKMTKKLLTGLKGRALIDYVLDVGLLVALVGVTASGIAMSDWVTISLGDALEDIHEFFANAIGFMVVVHIVRHWNWIFFNVKKYIFRVNSPKKRLSSRSAAT